MATDSTKSSKKAAFLGLLHILAPMIIAAIPDKRIQAVGGTILTGMSEAEQLIADPAERRAHVINEAVLVGTGINQVKGQPVVDPIVLGDAVGKTVDAIVQATNTVRDLHLELSKVQAAAVPAAAVPDASTGPSADVSKG